MHYLPEDKKLLRRNSTFAAVHVIFTTVALAIVFLMASHYAGIGTLGQWSVASALSALCGVADLGVTDAMVRQVPQRRREHDHDGVTRLVLVCLMFVAASVGVACAVAVPLIRGALHSLVGSFAPGLVESAVVVALLNVLAAGLLGTLEGLEEYGRRLLAGMLSSGATILAAVFLLPSQGVSGLPIVFVIQSAVLFLASAWFVTRVLRGGWRLTNHIKMDLRQLIRLGLPLRAAGIVNLAFEPVTRILLAKVAGAEAVGLYEIAARLTTQLRGVIVGATQVIVPRLVMLARAPEAGATVLREAANILASVAVTAFIGLVLGLPLVSFVLLGRIDSQLLAFGTLLSFAWFVNALSSPAYFSNVVDAKLSRNVLSHLAIGVLNIVLGGSLGMIAGAIGVVAGTAAALVAGSVVTILSTKPRVIFPDDLFRGDRVVCLGGIAALTALLAAFYLMPGQSARLTASAILTAAFGVLSVLHGIPRVRGGMIRVPTRSDA
jgi:O-antigen/teichoic acid export membrane protein